MRVLAALLGVGFVGVLVGPFGLGGRVGREGDLRFERGVGRGGRSGRGGWHGGTSYWEG
jgi:hypothetical protein